MANNVTNPNPTTPPPVSQVYARPVRAILGAPVTQAPPGVAALNTTSITGDIIPFTYNASKGKGNN
jgi:hypothetical protein